MCITTEEGVIRQATRIWPPGLTVAAHYHCSQDCVSPDLNDQSADLSDVCFDR